VAGQVSLGWLLGSGRAGIPVLAPCGKALSVRWSRDNSPAQEKAMAGLVSLGWALGSGGAGIPGLVPWK